MAEIRPFRGLRYSADAGPIESLTAPPYDVLSPADREQYASRSLHNVVHLTLPEHKSDDRSKYVRYARSAALLTEWRKDGTLALEDRPAIYRLTQSFSLPRHAGSYTRTSIIALIKVEPYENGVVLPHEQTFPKHKEDRLRILEATRSHLECIFGLYEDPNGDVLSAIQSAAVGSEVVTRSDDGVHQHLEPILDEEVTQRVMALLSDKKVWIADGHHRYETALAFRQSQGEREGSIAEDYMLMALTSMSDPGLVLLPTHRIVSTVPGGPEQALAKLAQVFDITEHHSRNMEAHLAREQAEGRRAFGVALEGGRGYVLVPKDDQTLLGMIDTQDTPHLKGLDVTVLHRVILEKILGVQGLDNISYTRDPLEAVRSADEGQGIAFLMNPPTVDDMKTIALGGEKMPQKSTYYYPKILSGLVLWSLNDFV
jgi:uncharacterized protein (DUF1015 family)